MRRPTRLPVTRRAPLTAVLVASLAAGGAGTAWAASSRSVSASGTVKLHHREPATKTIEQRGTVSGKPFGKGSLTLRSKLVARKKLSFSVRLRTAKGTVTGNGTATVKASGNRSSFRGTLRILAGSGAYRRISRTTITVAGTGDSTSRSTAVRFSGRVRY